jgi:hypothetical protein
MCWKVSNNSEVLVGVVWGRQKMKFCAGCKAEKVVESPVRKARLGSTLWGEVTHIEESGVCWSKAVRCTRKKRGYLSGIAELEWRKMKLMMVKGEIKYSTGAVWRAFGAKENNSSSFDGIHPATVSLAFLRHELGIQEKANHVMWKWMTALHWTTYAVGSKVTGTYCSVTLVHSTRRSDISAMSKTVNISLGTYYSVLKITKR